MDTAKVMLTPHERGSEVDLDVRGMSLLERLGAVWAALVGMFSGRIHVHLFHARVQSSGALRDEGASRSGQGRF